MSAAIMTTSGFVGRPGKLFAPVRVSRCAACQFAADGVAFASERVVNKKVANVEDIYLKLAKMRGGLCCWRS